MHYLLFYEKVADHAVREKPVQKAHLDHVMAAIERGDVVLAGSLMDPDDGAALLVFKSDTPAVAESFAQLDPYVTHGVIKRWHVRAWMTLP